ncbi:MAG TPA: hypothetical protein VN704_04035, partial [Verrucomicrobiae bacterium]|nr:hypothetical protein [Verrucomicrobiae bacterium]
IGSKEDQVVVMERGIVVMNVSGYPKAEPKAASESFAQCMVHFLEDIVSSTGDFHIENTLLKAL